ncbi:MAG: DUF1461 domain-containing protein [Clostridia bacterium]
MAHWSASRFAHLSKVAGFLAAFLLMLLAIGAAIYLPALQEKFFEKALLSTLDLAALDTDEASIRAFASDTIRYLAGRRAHWSPTITLCGQSATEFITQAFRVHMADVRGWAASGQALLCWGLCAAILCLIAACLGERFPTRAYCWGAALPLLLMGGVALWGALDFDSLWMALHRTLIPDGIFSASEPIMRLFPLEAFAAYLPPVAALFAGLALGVLLLPALLVPLRRAMNR